MEGRKPRILHIDDDEAMRRLVKDTLEEAGFSVQNAARVAEGVDCGVDDPPDLILLDLLIPGIDGYDACGFIKTMIPSLQSVPVVIVTGVTESANLKRAVECGAAAYLTKPFELEQLVETVRAWLPKTPE